MKNKEMTILKALGIIVVVMGHGANLFESWNNPYAYHMALFIFVSGYFYNIKYENNIITFIKKRFKSMMVPYFAYNLFYALLTYLIFKKYNILLGELPTMHSFFVIPFLNGHQYHLFVSAWFVPYLFIMQIVFLFLYKFMRKVFKNIHVQLVIFTAIGLMGTTLPLVIPLVGANLLFVKILFGLFFFFLGLYYRNIIESKSIINTKILIAVMVVQIILANKYGDIGYSLAWANYTGRKIVPFITSISGIYCLIFISKGLAKILDDNDLLIKIGENSFHIMVNHLLVFFLMNLSLVYIKGLDINSLSSVWFKYNPQKYWWLYAILGVVLPTYVAIYSKKVRLYIRDMFKNISKNKGIKH